MLEEFKKFAIVNSLVGDILSPIIGAVAGGFDFTNYFIPLSSSITADSLAEAKKQGAVLAWGNFLTVLINFIIIAWVLFIVVKVMNQMIHSEPQAPPLSKQEMLLTEIRDLLKRPRPINGNQER
jgi:large conductance mechanosensitive channel